MAKVATLPISFMANALRRLQSVFPPGYFPEAKHNHYADFGWPTTLSFEQLFSMYERNSLASAAIHKTSIKCWRDSPEILETEDSDKETKAEAEIRKRFRDIRLWQRVVETDRRSMVGNYAGLILRFADNKRFAEPADSVPGGLDGLVEVIPAWEGQLRVSRWDSDERSETYGQPLMFVFNEAEVQEDGNQQPRQRAFEIHPSRVIVWSTNGTVHGRSLLAAGYNDLMTVEKVVGAGGEGFWKTAKAALRMNVAPEAQLDAMATAMGFADVSEMFDAMNEQVEAFNKGFDQALLTQGIETEPLSVSLPSPEHFYAAPLQNFAASVGMPVKILVGMQTGERASKEDADEWSETCQSRRNEVLQPNIRTLINRLVEVGILRDADWEIHWPDLTESSMADKIHRAERMAKINQVMLPTRELAFLPEEIRAVIEMKPLGAAGLLDDDLNDLNENEPDEEEDDG